MKIMRNFIKMITACAAIAAAPAVSAQTAKQSIGIMSGTAGSTSATLGEELGRALDGWSGVTVKTMIGRGSQQNIEDLLYLRGVDFAFLNTDVMANLRITQPDHPALTSLSYLTKVTDAELHLVVRDDSDIQSVYDLAGRRVSLGNVGSGTALTSRLILRLLDVKSTGVFLLPSLGLASLADEEIDGVFVVGAKPLPILENITAEDGFRLVSIPFSDRLASIYDQASFTSDDYPNLVTDKLVEGISVPVVLAVYDKFSKGSSRYKNIVTFSEAFLETIPRLQQPPRHPKWREIDLEAKVDGWRRFEYFEGLVGQ